MEKNDEKTCEVCFTTFSLEDLRRRTICPICGNFFSKADEKAAHSIAHRKISRNQSEPDYPTGAPIHQKNKKNKLSNRISLFFGKLKNRPNSAESSSSQPRSNSIERSSDALEENSTFSHSMTMSDIAKNSEAQPPTVALDDFGTDDGDMAKDDGLEELSASILQPCSTYSANVDYSMAAKTCDDLSRDVANSKESGDWSSLVLFFGTVFGNAAQMVAVFGADSSTQPPSEDELNVTKAAQYYKLLMLCSPVVHKAVLSAICNFLLTEARSANDNDARAVRLAQAYVLLLLNPLFNDTAHHAILAHLLRTVTSQRAEIGRHMVRCCRCLDRRRFRAAVNRLNYFVSCALLPDNRSLQTLSRSRFWVPAAVRTLSLLYAANNEGAAIVEYTEFYNATVKHANLFKEYTTWQESGRLPCARFSLCQYPFILDLAAKRKILECDSEQQMLLKAKESLIDRMKRGQEPSSGIFFLRIEVRRSHLVSDSIAEVSRQASQLKKKLKVSFIGEQGLDMGGLTKEWFLLLIKKVFRTEYGLFSYDKLGGCHWFVSSAVENLQEFHLVGVLMGLAVYNGIILDVRFPSVCYRKLLSPAVVPQTAEGAERIGQVAATVEDVASMDPTVAQSLRELLAYEGSVEDDFGLSFAASFERFGNTETVELVAGGLQQAVTKANRQEYVAAYADLVVNRLIKRQFDAFYRGFHTVCASNALLLLRAEEVEMLVCGKPSLDVEELRRCTTYVGYKASDATVRYLWELLLSWSPALQRRFLLFVTGSDRVPPTGVAELNFRVCRVENVNMLPVSFTCFNKFGLPDYNSRTLLKQKLLCALEFGEGFGMQ